MNFTHLKAFYTVAKLKSFTLAARELNVSQPTLSQQVKSLEQQFDLPLIKRNRRVITLTLEGETIYSYADKLMVIAGEMGREIENLHTRQLKIGTTPTLSRYFLPSIVLKLKKNDPDLKVQIYTGLSKEILKMVLDFECHVGLVGRVSYPDHVIFRNIFKPKLSFISNDIGKEKIHLKELSDYPIILPEEGSATRDYIIGEFKKRDIPLNNFMDCENPAAIKHMVHLRMGGAFFTY
jgi:DNA-binding transcriptional LysR family regulator